METPSTPRIRLAGITKRFGSVLAVDKLSLAVNAGEVYACIGPNGSGKTTTVKMAAGVWLPTNGTLALNGTDLWAAPEKAKQMLGYVPDEPYVYEKMTGREFLGFVGRLFGMTSPDIAAGIARLAPNFPELVGVLDEATEGYSRGSKQKLAFTAAILHAPNVLLVDEPMVGLDPESARTVQQLLADFAKGGGAVFLSTHAMPVAEALATRIGVLAHGRLIAEGTLTELRAKAGLPAASLEDVYLALTRSKALSNPHHA